MCIFEEKPEETTLETLVDWEYAVCWWLLSVKWFTQLISYISW